MLRVELAGPLKEMRLPGDVSVLTTGGPERAAHRIAARAARLREHAVAEVLRLEPGCARMSEGTRRWAGQHARPAASGPLDDLPLRLLRAGCELEALFVGIV
jgi:hypothetical protein